MAKNKDKNKIKKTKSSKLNKTNKQLIFFVLPAPISHAASRVKVIPGAFAKASWYPAGQAFVRALSPCRLL